MDADARGGSSRRRACKEGSGSGSEEGREKEGGEDQKKLRKEVFKRYKIFSMLISPFLFSTHLVVRLQERPGSVDDGVDGEAVALCSGLDALRERPLETSPDGILVTVPLLLWSGLICLL